MCEQWIDLFASLCDQDYQRQMQRLDGEMTEVNEWIDGAEKKMEEMDREGPNDTVLKVLNVFSSLRSTCPLYLAFSHDFQFPMDFIFFFFFLLYLSKLLVSLCNIIWVIQGSGRHSYSTFFVTPHQHCQQCERVNNEISLKSFSMSPS